MDFQSALPAFLLLGSAVATIVMRMQPGQGQTYQQAANNKWAIGISLAIISSVSTYVMSQTGIAGSVISEDQYMLAMLITTVFLLLYYMCKWGGDNVAPPPRLQAQSTATCCGGDIRNKMVNTSCPPELPQPRPYPPCIDNIYNEGCYSKPFIPEGAVPCEETDERRMRIRWEKRQECPKHGEMVLKGNYPWNPETPNWQNRTYVDANADLWYGANPGYAPMRDRNRHIIGRLLEEDDKNVRVVPNPGDPTNPLKIKRKKKPRQDFLWGMPPPKQARFNPPDISYVPESYSPPDFNPGEDAGLPNVDNLAVIPNSFMALPTDERAYRQLGDDNSNDVVADNWKVILICAVILMVHRAYRNVVSLASNRSLGFGLAKQRRVDPLQLVGEDPSVLADAIKQDATMMILLLSVACSIMLLGMTKSRNTRAQMPMRSEAGVGTVVR